VKGPKGASAALLGCATLASCSVMYAYDESLVGEICDNGVDDDRDGLIDCWDRQGCSEHLACREDDLDRCIDGADNDRDGLADCEDPACREYVHCSEGSEETCLDGVDNDLDGAADCADPACYGWFECFPASRLVRDDCPVPPAAASLRDDFDGDALSGDQWSAFAAPETGSAVVADGQLRLQGGLEAGTSVVSKQALVLGARQVFRAEFTLRPEGDCAAGPQSAEHCELWLGLHTRSEWGGSAPLRGEPVWGLTVVSGEQPNELDVSCTYHGVALERSSDAPWRYEVGDTLELAVSLDERGRRAIYSLAGEEHCRSPRLLAEEPAAHLVLHAPSDGAGLLIDDVRLEIARGANEGDCAGQRAPLFDDAWCSAAEHNGGIERLVVAKGPTEPSDSFHMLAQVDHDQTHRHLLYGLAPTGRDDWGFATLRASPVQSEPGDRPSVGGLLYNPVAERLEAWLVERPAGGAATQARFVLPRTGSETLWDEPEPYATEGPLPAGWDAWSMDSVVLAAGRYLAFYGVDSGLDGRAVYRAESEGGLQWRLSDQPVLGPGGPGTWDEAGPESPAVAQVGDYLVMAYASGRYGEPLAVGLAASRDGQEWVRHQDNPVLTGETEGFDIDGIRPGGVLVDGRELVLWYLASWKEARSCPDDAEGPSVSEQRRAGMAVLRLAD